MVSAGSSQLPSFRQDSFAAVSVALPLPSPRTTVGLRHLRVDDRELSDDESSSVTSPRSILTMQTMVEVGDWEHECCGPSYERDTVIEFTCLVVSGQDDAATRYVESHHDLTSQHDTIRLRGRVVDICIQRPDGSSEQIERLPSGRALRGFDDDDDGHLKQPWTGESVTNDSNRYLVTIAH